MCETGRNGDCIEMRNFLFQCIKSHTASPH